MRRRSGIVFLIINVIVSIGVVVLALSFLNRETAPTAQQPIVITVPVLMTATIDPNAATQTPFIITATPMPGTVLLPTGLIELTAIDRTQVPVSTIDPTLIGASASLQGTVTALPTNCVPYTLQDGDTPYGIALQYDVDFATILAVNGLTETDAGFLQIGQVLIVPLEGCELTTQSLSASQTATFLPTNTFTPTGTLPSPTFTPSPTVATDTPSATPTRTSTNTPIPSSTAPPTSTPSISPTPSNTTTQTPVPTRTPSPQPTQPPTAVDASVIIRQVLGAGNINTETLDVGSTGATVDISGWTLRTSRGDIYTFPEDRLLLSNGTLVINTRAGNDTPAALYWGRTQPAYGSGMTVTLFNAAGQAQSVYAIP